MPELVTNPLLASALSRSNPFPGLRPYEEQDANWFFGRSAEINDLLKRLRRLHFVAIVGASGSGKSSLVRAGVLPQIRDGYLDADWLIATFRPGERPIANLAEALHPAVPGELGDFTSTLRSGPLGLVRALERARLTPDSNVLILVDQFEELFQFAQRTGDSAQEEVKEFLKLLLAAAASDDVPVYVVVTMRLEWLHECATYTGLAEAINEGIYLVPQMSRRQFQQAILGPLEAAGGGITTSLLGRMLNDLDTRSDQLPVLQHALMRIWQRVGAKEPFDMGAYEKVGTFSKCLSAHAEEVFTELSEQEKKVAQILFRAITQVSKNRKIRRPRPASDILRMPGVEFAQLASVVLAFGKPGRSFLVTTEGALTPDSIIDISHEALIRQWVRLGGWVDSEAEIQSRISRLEEDAVDWDANREGLKGCLYRGSQLTRAEELRPLLAPESKAIPFLDESRRTRFWLLLWTRGSIALGLLLLIGLVAYLSFLKVDSSRKSYALLRAQADFASLQAKKSKEFQEDLVRKVDAAHGDPAALAQIAQSIQAKRVYLQYFAGQVQTAKLVQAGLRKQGYAVPGYEQVSSDKAPATTQVRYFHPEDKADASAVAAALGGLVPGNVSVQAIANPNGVVPSGQMEVWLVPSASAQVPPQQQQQASPAVVAPAPAQVPDNTAAHEKPAVILAPFIEAAAMEKKIQQGQSSGLVWNSQGVSELQIEGIGPVAATGSMKVTPQQTTTYKFVATNDGGTTTNLVTIEVTPAPVAAVVHDEPLTAVKAALTRYKEAYESESIDDLKRAWPSIDKAHEKNAKFIFEQFNAIRLSLACPADATSIEGDLATATCTESATYTQRGKKQPEQVTQAHFNLAKQNGAWVIVKVE